MNNFVFFNSLVKKIGQNYIELDRSNITKYESEFFLLSDEEIKKLCLETLSGTDTSTKTTDKNLIYKLFSKATNLFNRKDPLTLRRIALAANAFSRCPADLPEGSKLFPQQIKASIALTHNCLIQMDTGEGKTYALLPTGFALACEYSQVYIICANKYLAWRDATRTRSFWNFTGIDNGLCIGEATDDWSKRIIYTTLSELIFHHLNASLNKTKLDDSISFGAVLLDEADQILLDQSFDNHQFVVNLKTDVFDWSFALEYLNGLIEGIDIIVDRENLTANLTIKAEEDLAEVLKQPKNLNLNYFLTRYAVETSYVAIKVAAEDVHYVIENNQIFSVNLINGQIDKYKTPNWITPLEVTKGFPPRPETVALDEISPNLLLNKFDHISGMSGTIIDDSLEYLFSFYLPTIYINPRNKRNGKIEPDLIFQKKENAFECVCDFILAGLHHKRPVLVGTQSIFDAERVYEKLKAKAPNGGNFVLLTGKNEKEAATVFEKAGEVGSVIISTQLAGRGVDIRLSPESKNNGGLSLISLGHSQTERYDKQFLGRAGRQGDPFDAYFICSLEDDLMNLFAGDRTANMMSFLGMAGNTCVQSPVVSKQIRNLQRQIRKNQFLRQRQSAMSYSGYEEIRDSVEIWFEYLQIPHDELTKKIYGQADIELPSHDFIEKVSKHFVEKIFAESLKNKKSISASEARQIAETFNNMLGVQELPDRLLPIEIESLDAKPIADFILLKIQNLLKIQFEKYAHQKIEIINKYEELYEKLIAFDFLSQFEVLELEISEAGEIVEANLTDSARKNQEDHKNFTLLWKQKSLYESRTPLNIAYWSLKTIWMEFIQARKRIINRVHQNELSIIEASRVISDQVSNEWDKMEGEISARALFNLLQCPQPHSLNDLFIYEDNEAVDFQNESDTDNFKWEYQNSETNTPNHKQNIVNLIEQFTNRNVEELDNEDNKEGFGPSRLRRLLFDFLKHSPLHMLQTPSQVQDALERWFANEIAIGVTKERRKLNKKWLRSFLIFLKERNLSGPLPKIQYSVRSFFSKLVKNISESRTAGRFAGLVIFLALFITVLYFGNIFHPINLSPFWAAIDAVIFGGLISNGNILAPSFGLIVCGVILNKIIKPGDDIIMGTGFDKIIVPISQIFLSVVLVQQLAAYGDIWLNIKSIIILLIMIFLARLTQKVTFFFETDVGLSLVYGWLSYTLLFVFPLNTFGGFLNNKLSYIVFFTFPLLIYLWQFFNLKEIAIETVMLRDSSRSMNFEEVSSAKNVSSDCGLAPHIFGLITSWLVYDISNFIFPNYVQDHRLITFIILSVIYVSICILFIAISLRRKFSPDLWHDLLNKKHQRLKGITDSFSLNQKLKQLELNLLFKEILFQTISILIISFLLHDLYLPQTGFPLSLFVISMAWLLFVSFSIFVKQLYQFLVSRIPFSVEVLDLSSLSELEKEIDSKKLKWWVFVKKRLAPIIFSVTLVFQFLKIFGDVNDIMEFFNKAFTYFGILGN